MGYLKCDLCGRKEDVPYDDEDECYCGGIFKLAEAQTQQQAGASNSSDLLVAMKGFLKRMRNSEEYSGIMDQNAPTSFWRAKEEVYEELADELEKILGGY